MQSVDLNYLAIIASTAVMMMLGFLWYGPFFAKQWLAAIGRSEDEIKPPPAWQWALIVGGALISAFVLAVIVDWAEVTELVDGVFVGLIVSAGMIVTDSIKRYVYEEGPSALLAINNGYVLVGFALMGAILGAWQ